MRALWRIPGILILFILITGCGPAPETVAVEVAAGIEATVAAAPTATPQPTLTPAPTLTSRPTHTPQPTLPPAATLTPRPTLTTQPTYTPLPTLTPPPTNTPAPTAVVVAGGGNDQNSSTGSAEPFDTRHLNIVRNYMNTMTGMIRQRAIYDPNQPWQIIGYDKSLVCSEYLGTFYGYRDRLIMTPPAGGDQVQAAFVLYQQAITTFTPEADRWRVRCENDDDGIVRFSNADSNAMIVVRDASLPLLDQAKSLLNNSDAQ